MAPESICRLLHGAGLHIRSDGERLRVSPVELLTDEIRQLLREYKPALLGFLADVQQTTDKLIEAAMLVCERHADIEQARADMRADVLATPPHLRADLLRHFRETGSAAAEIPGARHPPAYRQSRRPRA